MQSDRLLGYLRTGIEQLLEQGGFDGGQPFRPTQRQALEAYKNYLNSNRLTPEEKLKGFFEIPTGVGKTAVFIGIVGAAHKAAEANGEELKTAIVVPTTQLLHQTYTAFSGDNEDFNGFLPNFKKRIGLYGDGHKSLDKAITIMTYDAWYDLSTSGRLGSKNIDILISDEAHRGTSERRIENIKGAFNEQTAQVAFTATAHFDSDKSVEGSHEREIFYKSMRQAVQEGELAAYVQSQRAIIRVRPSKYMLSKAFSDASEWAQIKYRRRLRQKTWNAFALKTFREGVDERTGNLLSDNQAGFFVGGTHQADELEDMLNSDPVLKRRAKEQGREGVAVAIHTRGMSTPEQKRRFKAYMSGEYMAVVGDAKFKEGFDHPPMKTLFDYHRASLVDKVQILGRGARKWWNDAKDRWEGLTVIDTAIYIGSEDKEENELARARAIVQSLSVKDVLEESVVVGPDDDWDKRKKGGKTRGKSGGTPISGGDLFDDDPDIEYYTDIEHIYELEGNAQDWLADRGGFVITLADIKEAIDGYKARNNGRNPSGRTKGMVQDGSFAGKVGWTAVVSWFFRGANGLSEDPEFQKWAEELAAQKKKPSFSLFLKKLGYRKTRAMLDGSESLTVENLKLSIESFRKNNAGKNPRKRSGVISEGPMKGRAWTGINSALENGYGDLALDRDYQRWVRKLKKQNITPSLANFLVEFGYQESSSHARQRVNLRLVDVFKAANHHKDVHGKYPTGRLKDFAKISGAEQVYTWIGLNAALMSGNNGLDQDLSWKKWSNKLQKRGVRPSLSQLIQNPPREIVTPQ